MRQKLKHFVQGKPHDDIEQKKACEFIAVKTNESAKGCRDAVIILVMQICIEGERPRSGQQD